MKLDSTIRINASDRLRKRKTPSSASSSGPVKGRRGVSLAHNLPHEGPTQGQFRGGQVGGRVLSLSDLEIPVRRLLTHREEILLGRKIQAGFRRLRSLLPLLVEGYERFLEQMGRVAVGSQVVVGWFHLREQLERDIQEATAQLDRAKGLAARAPLRPRKNGARKNGLEGSWFTRETEKSILRAMDQGIKVLRQYPLDPETLFAWSREIGLGSGDPGPLSRTSRDQKAVRIINRTVAIIEGARDRLVLPNFRLILKEVFRYNPAGMKRSDLFQEGILGLHRAVFRYDPERKTRFSTYATYWIRQAIRKSLIDRSRLIRIPQAVQEELRNPDSRLTEQEVQRLRRVMGEGVSLSAGEDDDPRDRLSFESLQLSGPSHHEQLHIGVIPEAVEKALLSLEVREREILKRRFGIGGDRVQTLEEIGVALHLSRERIRQIEREALEKMKRQGALQAVYEELS